MGEPKWIEKKSILAFHHLQIAEHGGEAGLLSDNLLDSAIANPKNFFHYTQPSPDLSSVAARYAFSLARNHAFVDGNKRVAAMTCEVFLEKNGYELNASEQECYRVFIELASGELDADDVANWIRDNIAPLS